jgi:hypothetical protein
MQNMRNHLPEPRLAFPQVEIAAGHRKPIGFELAYLN